mgnify:CR=1 FL=1
MPPMTAPRLTAQQLEQIAKRSLYDISRRNLYRVQGKNLAEVDANIAEATKIVAACIVRAIQDAGEGK